MAEGFGVNVKKTESIAIDTNTKALLEQVALVDVLDGWKSGLLTIGTLGFDPLGHFDEHMVDCVNVSIEIDDDRVLQDESSNHKENDGDHVLEELNPLIMSGADEGNLGVPDEILAFTSGPCMEPTSETTTLDGAGLEIRRRKTLRDLFSEESEVIESKKSSEPRKGVDSGKKMAPLKKGLFFPKKVTPTPDESRPIKKLNQMMRRMLKRKIHPELQGKPRKLEKESQICAHEAFAAEKLGAPESISLLQTSGGKI